MKPLFDQNLSFKLCAMVEDLFPCSAQVRQFDLDHASDLTIWEFAATHGYIIVSQDVDFADIAAVRGAPPHVVLLRCGNQPTAIVAKLFRDSADQIKLLEADASLSIVELSLN